SRKGNLQRALVIRERKVDNLMATLVGQVRPDYHLQSRNTILSARCERLVRQDAGDNSREDDRRFHRFGKGVIPNPLAVALEVPHLPALVYSDATNVAFDCYERVLDLQIERKINEGSRSVSKAEQTESAWIMIISTTRVYLGDRVQVAGDPRRLAV